MELKDFEIYLFDLGLQERSIKQSIGCIRRLLSECSFTKPEVDAFLRNKRYAKCKQSTINKYISAIKHYGAFTGNDFASAYKRKSEGFDHEETPLISESDIDRIISYKPLPNMHSLYFALLNATAGRPSEVLTLKTSDVHDDLLYVRGKVGGRYLVVPRHLADHLATFMGKRSTEYVFENPQTGKHYSLEAFNKEFRKRTKELGISSKIRLYSFRHSTADRIGDNVSLKVLQDILGHKKIETTGKYLRSNVKKKRLAVLSDPIHRTHIPPEDELEMIAKELSKLVDVASDRLKVSTSKSDDVFSLHIEVVSKK